MEMSTFYHGLWCVRLRIGAWDHPCCGRKRFIDLHCRSNADSRGLFLRGTLGWWTLGDDARRVSTSSWTTWNTLSPAASGTTWVSR